ncbi:helix-turn-helix transcriptional regulator [Sphingomonas sp. ID1715]|uniref:helix-turn-helix transcriptional regulator n=1 Tax=Sphingomonas sp. ID1715 TaxID=1656898 RepID=UPI001488A61A|nr:helix-turn-helix transcriptional regulator [Sphingomonas sp. ID1715]NNM76200.1 helix-turn-helix transcriptional regulator [Sphingomonas sp. ID1715]
MSISTRRAPVDDLPATARLRGGLMIAPDIESLVELFAGALEEHGIDGHFCLARSGEQLVPAAGDMASLINATDVLTVEVEASALPGALVLLARPNRPLSREAWARVRGYAELFAARVLALQELADDVDTECGLTLRERYVLGRRLAGLAPIDIAEEAKLTVNAVSEAMDKAAAKLGADNVGEAIALAARRGWLAVTNLENCSSSSQNFTYKLTQNG